VNTAQYRLPSPGPGRPPLSPLQRLERKLSQRILALRKDGVEWLIPAATKAYERERRKLMANDD